MFAQRLAGHSVAGIARALNDSGITCPSGVDPGRNRHRKADGWTLRTVAVILANPRYTGRQVWNRQRTERDHLDGATGGHGHREVMRWNQAEDWVISTRMAHPGLISGADFVAAQAIRAARPTGDGTRPQIPARRPCDLSVLRAAHGRTLGQRPSRLPLPPWPHQRQPPANGHPKMLYRREDQLLTELAAHVEPHIARRSPNELVRHVQTNQTTIICDEVGCTLRRSTVSETRPSQGQQTLW
jgi:site-specific DNA recombinase